MATTFEQTKAASDAIIRAEKKNRDEKTARLKAARLEKQSHEPAQDVRRQSRQKSVKLKKSR
jgi:hypothetical protein